MLKRHFSGVLLFLICGFSPLYVLAGDSQSHESIYSSVESFVSDALIDDESRITVKRLDERLRLKHCESPLDIFWAPGARQVGTTSVGVACTAGKPWKIYVRVDIAITKDIYVANRMLRRGDVLSEADLRIDKKDISRLGSNYLQDSSRVIGYEVTQTVDAGRVITERMVKMPKWVARGQKVTIIAVTAGLEVKMMGEALSDGGKGAIIRVKNSRSKKTVQGEVIEKGVVKVLM